MDINKVLKVITNYIDATFCSLTLESVQLNGLISLPRKSLAIACIAPISYWLYTFIIHPFYLTPLRKVPGPKVKNPFLLLGMIPDILPEEPLVMHRKWVKEYGDIVRIHGIFNRPQILFDMSLGTHVHLYGKNLPLFKEVSKAIGHGLLTVDGDVHKRQRAIINPKCPKTTLDVIGRAGFGHEFNAVSNGVSPLYESYSHILQDFSMRQFIINYFLPFVKYIVPSEWRKHVKKLEARKTVGKICTEMVLTRLEACTPAGRSGGPANDLLTVLVQANLSVDPRHRLSDEEVVAQVTTFLLAGHETTSVALTWTLYFLAKHPEIQIELRNELCQDMPSKQNDPTVDLITSTTNYLEAVAKESLRLAPPAVLTNRIANEDDMIDGYKIPKGTFIIISQEVMHKKEEFWGPDVLEFKPSRWMKQSTPLDSSSTLGIPHLPKKSSPLTDIDGGGGKPYGAYMPFLMGTRNCIGSRFAMLELKCILAVLVRNFEFDLVDGFVFRKTTQLTLKPDPCLKLQLKKVLLI
ncbi:cytochrome P450 [Obelidium mucronatum]|nr:cytochrome P450 [Obelidium mucronatum]